MSGQMRSSDAREYLQYVEEHSITDPSEIPEEVLDTFMLPENPERIAF